MSLPRFNVSDIKLMISFDVDVAKVDRLMFIHFLPMQYDL